jgi:hypothetical protein
MFFSQLLVEQFFSGLLQRKVEREGEVGSEARFANDFAADQLAATIEDDFPFASQASQMPFVLSLETTASLAISRPVVEWIVRRRA